MSWRASAWAKEQRLGSPAAKSILMCLGDYADPDTCACWPSQQQLAADAEVSERTAREWLQRLDDWGLISRERRSRANGARASDRIVLNLGANVRDGAERLRGIKGEADTDGENLPAEIAGRTNRQPDAEPTGNGAQPTGNQFRPYKDEPSIEPSNGTSQPRAEARAREGEDARQTKEALERRFWKMARGHPQSAGMPKASWLAAWMKLSPDEQDRAEARYPAWLALLKAQSKDHVPALSKYFWQRLFDEVPDAPEPAAPTTLEAKPFGPLWNAINLRDMRLTAPQPAPPPTSAYMRDLVAEDSERGRRERLRRQAEYGWPMVNHRYRQAQSRKGFTARAEDVWLESLMEAVLVDSPTMAAWREFYEAEGMPWVPDWGDMRVVFFPAGGPQALDAFERALREAGNDAGRTQAAG